MKERTLRGPHQGKRLYLGTLHGEDRYATVWDGMLLLKRNALPHPLIREWRGRLIVGGRFWRLVPHAFVKNPLNYMLYEDTLLNALTLPVRECLIPGYPGLNWWERRLARWLRKRVR